MSDADGPIVFSDWHERAMRFFRVFIGLPDDAEVCVGGCLVDVEEGGKDEAVFVEFDDDLHVFSLYEARDLARICEDALTKFYGMPEMKGIPDLIMSLRASADKMDPLNAKPI